jgi:hypothetical protein
MENCKLEDKCVVLDLEHYIHLLECKLNLLERLEQEDSSWNYDIESLEKEISDLKNNI